MTMQALVFGDILWESVAEYAHNCSWSAGQFWRTKCVRTNSMTGKECSLRWKVIILPGTVRLRQLIVYRTFRIPRMSVLCSSARNTEGTG